MSDKKIISLLPAATEIVCGLGLKDQLVGRSHECDSPESIIDLPVCSSAKFVSGSSSIEIDQQVKDVLSDALSIYTIDKEKVKDLDPAVIITQAQCEVCAVSLKDVEETLQEVLQNNVEVISLNPRTLSDIFNEIVLIAERLGVRDKGEEFVSELQERCDLIHHKLKFVEQRPSVVCIEWLSPLMVAGNWTPELISIAGGRSLLAEKGKHSGYINFDAIKSADPEVIIVAPCGFPMERTLQEINLLLELPGWYNLQAVKNDKVFICNGNQYFNRSSQKVVDTIELLAEILHPKQFVFGYEGKGWLKFSC
ncbi:cobalamin-binding protein [Paradesertivirga mongoliensis]|uniref:Cobalamin-binding protein n=1 Tax=Paradesertivirga mongoliensis TaxID=2100740 RepID=A0ABW4ZG95_9SPHI|nr:cobalamin-binding protein [Pedobacter mongoliensis]